MFLGFVNMKINLCLYRSLHWIFIYAVFIKGIQTTPSMEECPHDSIDLDGNCFCNPESCTKPLCLFDLELATNGTDLPGDCCPTYSCVGCANETMIEGQCPCAEGAVLDSNGICKCTDDEKSLVDGKCECDTNLCELPEVCNDTSVRVTEETGGCCKKTKCIECPFDSYPTNRGSDEIEEKCSCYKCKYDCGKNEVRVEKQGTGFPGSCCDLYQCVESSDFCNVGNNNTYKNGENWTSNGQFCICQNGISKCFRDNNKEDQKQYCRKDGINYQDGESWTDEECTNCTCHNGTETCVSHFCDLTETQKEFVRTPHNCANSTDGTWQMIGSCKNCTCRNGTSHCISICDTFDRNKITCSPLLNCNKKCNLGFKIKYGCEICKCNRYLDLLIRKNISDVDFMKFIEEFHITTFTPMTTTSSTIETTTITSDDPICIGKKDPSNDFLEDHSSHLVCYILLMVFGAVLILAILAVIFMYRKCQSHSKQDSLNIINCKYNPIVNQNNNIKEM